MARSPASFVCAGSPFRGLPRRRTKPCDLGCVSLRHKEAALPERLRDFAHAFRMDRCENPGMASTDELSSEELDLLATEWRRRALQGDLHARGIAHEFEAELRRRSGAVFTSYDTLDLRSLESRQHHPWWRFWRKRTVADASF